MYQANVDVRVDSMKHKHHKVCEKIHVLLSFSLRGTYLKLKGQQHAHKW